MVSYYNSTNLCCIFAGVTTASYPSIILKRAFGSLSLSQKAVSPASNTKFALSDVEWEKVDSPKTIWITVQEFHSIGKKGEGWHICGVYYVVEARASPGLAWLTPQIIRLFNNLGMEYIAADDGDGVGFLYRFKVTKQRGKGIKRFDKDELGYVLQQALLKNVPKAILVTYSVLEPAKVDAALGEVTGTILRSAIPVGCNFDRRLKDGLKQFGFLTRPPVHLFC